MTLILQGFFGFAPIKALIHRLQNKIARLKVAWVAGKQWLNYLTTLLLCTYIQQELPRAKAFQPAWPPASVPVTSFHSLLSVLHTTTNYSLSNFQPLLPSSPHQTKHSDLPSISQIQSCHLRVYHFEPFRQLLLLLLFFNTSAKLSFPPSKCLTPFQRPGT